jgi:hypothetical protein
MPSLGTFAEALVHTLRRHRRKSRILALGILVYVAVIATVGGVDVMIGPVRFRSNDTDWLLRLAFVAAVLDLALSETAFARILGFFRKLRADALRVRPLAIRTAIVIAAAAVLLWVAGRLVTTMPPETVGGDMALLELYTRQASRSEALLGPYSRFQWNHPGPTMFYVFRPLYELSGGLFESLRMSALLLNLGCLAALLVIVRRRAGPTLLLPLALALSVYLYRVPDVLVSPWNPHLLLLPLALLFLACAAVVEGDVRFTVVAVAATSFLVQAHLSVTPTAGAVTAVALVCAVFGMTDDGRLRVRGRWINAAIWVGLLMWFLPLAEEVTSRPGNLSAILDSFFETPDPGPASREGAAAFFRMISAFMLPGFGTAWGGLVLKTVTWMGFALAAALLLTLPWAASRFATVRPFVSILAMLLFASSLVALWSVLRIQGELFDQLVFWVTIIGVLSTAVVASAGLLWAAARAPAAARLISGAAAVTSIGLLILAATLGASQLYDRGRERPHDPTAVRIREGAAAVSGFLKREGLRRPVARLGQSTWGDVAGIVLILEKDGIPVTVERDWVFMFGRPLEEDGTADSELIFADAARRKTVLEEGRHAILAEWPELTIFARKAPAPPAP